MHLFSRHKPRAWQNLSSVSRDFQEEADEGATELTLMIGYLVRTTSENWTLIRDVCDCATASESNAKEAICAVWRELKYGEPSAQISAVRLWAIMLRNSTDTVISESASRQFLNTVGDLLRSDQTSAIVRERLLKVVAAAAFASGSDSDGGFRDLWQRVKPSDKPDEGVPFETDDAMFNPPMSSRIIGYEVRIVRHQDTALLRDTIPREEEIRRLFSECDIGRGNASLLSQALMLSKPRDLRKKSVTKEFHTKCHSSQALISAQIPWASAEAERSRVEVNNLGMKRSLNGGNKNGDNGGRGNSRARKRAISNDDGLAVAGRGEITVPENGDTSLADVDATMEEKLLAALLQTNEELVEVLNQYHDLVYIAMERKAEKRSYREARKALEQQQEQLQHGHSLSNGTSNAGAFPVEQVQNLNQYNVPSRRELPSASVPSSRSPSPLPPGATMITPYQLALSTSSMPCINHKFPEGYHQPDAGATPMPQYQLDRQQHQQLTTDHNDNPRVVISVFNLQGERYDTNNAMVNPPILGHLSGYEGPVVQHPEATSLPEFTPLLGSNTDEPPPPRYSSIFPNFRRWRTPTRQARAEVNSSSEGGPQIRMNFRHSPV